MFLATAACYDDIEIFDLGSITVDGGIKNRGNSNSLEIYPRSNLVGTSLWYSFMVLMMVLTSHQMQLAQDTSKRQDL